MRWKGWWALETERPSSGGDGIPGAVSYTIEHMKLSR